LPAAIASLEIDVSQVSPMMLKIPYLPRKVSWKGIRRTKDQYDHWGFYMTKGGYEEVVKVPILDSYSAYNQSKKVSGQQPFYSLNGVVTRSTRVP
jgi:hypothetical protein